MKEALTHSTAGSTSATASATANSTPDGVDLNLNDLSGVEKTDSSKDGSSGNGVEKLDMNGLNRVNVLFSGCSFVTVDGLCDKTKTSGGDTCWLVGCCVGCVLLGLQALCLLKNAFHTAASI